MKTKYRYMLAVISAYIMLVIIFGKSKPKRPSINPYVSHEYIGYSLFELNKSLDNSENEVIWLDDEDVQGFSASDCPSTEKRKFPLESGRIFRPEELNLSNYEDQEPLIPAIIHQQWNTHKIPARAKDLIQSIIKKHPNWEYWLWTEKDKNCYVKTYHPELWSIWTSYNAVITRADAMRYIILADIGGFYLDLDIDCLKPLDAWRYVAPCLILHNGYETVFHWFNETIGKAAVSTVGCRPKHPFTMGLLDQDRLKCFRDRFIKKDVTRVAGSYYMNSMYYEYLQQNIGKMKFQDDIQVVHPR